jgi:hypothetical protein
LITSRQKIDAKIVLYDNGTAAVVVYLREADRAHELLTYERAVNPVAAEGVVQALATKHGVGADDIEVRYEDLRTVSRGGKPIRSRMN